MERWWENGGFRDKPHEGIDLCLYNDQSGSTRALDKAARIPGMYRGCVKNIIDDYIGKTIFMAHDIYNGHRKVSSIPFTAMWNYWAELKEE